MKKSISLALALLMTFPHNESSLYVDTLYIENIPNKKSFVHYMDFNNK